MKVYAFPSHIQKPEITFPFNPEAERQREVQASAELRAWLIHMGYTGPNTGEEYAIGHADGAARYMVAEGPAGSRVFSLIHLPYCDAWDSPWAKKVTRAEVIKHIQANKAWEARCAAQVVRPIRHRARVGG